MAFRNAHFLVVAGFPTFVFYSKNEISHPVNQIFL
jgi:hypothetical protein